VVNISISGEVKKEFFWGENIKMSGCEDLNGNSCKLCTKYQSMSTKNIDTLVDSLQRKKKTFLV
jgi:hypothetical protein